MILAHSGELYLLAILAISLSFGLVIGYVVLQVWAAIWVKGPFWKVAALLPVLPLALLTVGTAVALIQQKYFESNPGLGSVFRQTLPDLTARLGLLWLAMTASVLAAFPYLGILMAGFRMTRPRTPGNL
jgi:hypothetical protein